MATAADVQRRLVELGYGIAVDGVMGPRTFNALMAALASSMPAIIPKPAPIDLPPQSPTLMTVSGAGRKAITAHEGLRLRAYPDPATGGDPWTIGVGHTSAAGKPIVYKGMVITAADADEILSRDLGKFEAYVRNAVKVPLKQHEFDALVSLCFHIGPRNFNKSSVVRRLNAGDRAGVAEAFLLWNKAAGKVMPGLTRRRKEEREMFLGN